MSPDSEPGEVTLLIRRSLAGDQDAEAALIDLLYARLHEQAQCLLRDGAGSLQATQLVHDIWMRVFHSDACPDLQSRHAFLAYFARAMRNLLIDHVTRKKTKKRGGDWERTCLDELVAEYEACSQIDLIALNEALEQLRRENERQFRTVEARFFGGMTMSQIAEHLQVSLATAERDWALARAKLRHYLRDRFEDEA